MKRSLPEFSRRVEIARLPPSGGREVIEATLEECSALSKRLGLPGVLSLAAILEVEPWRRGGAKVSGALRAEIVQACVVTIEDFTTMLREPVERHYLPAAMGEGANEDDEADIVPDGVIDLGELVAETLALALDPYPRKPGAVFDGTGDEASSEGASPFGGLLERNSGEA